MLRAIELLVVDCQASGATPAHGDLLELGWAIGTVAADVAPSRADWIHPHTTRRVPGPVRKLTGWSEACLAHAIDAPEAWRRVLAGAAARPIPTAIHFARFELVFLRELHERVAPDVPFPLDVVCLHAIATRLLPDLPRLGLRALAGHLGHGTELRRNALGHVDASLFIWRAFVPLLEERGIRTWAELHAWLDAPAPTSRNGRDAKRVFPLPVATRRALPDRPGVYRYLRRNGDVLYVGKATSLKKRVASYFTGRSSGERALEMLSQVHDVEVTEVASTLEAALLETDEIKRLDPPYNIQLRRGDREAWFASRTWQTTSAAPDETHRIGPLPSARSLGGLAAMRALLEGDPITAERRAAAVGTPAVFAPSEALFAEVWRAFIARHFVRSGRVDTCILSAGASIVVSEDPDDEPRAEWDAAAVNRHLERVLASESMLVRRARLLALLCDARVVFREAKEGAPRLLVIREAEIVEQRAATDILADLAGPRTWRSRGSRLASFDATRYDRMRVLATELSRIMTQGGQVVIRVGSRWV